MARPIQRRTKKKKTVLKKEDAETTINTNMGENQAVQTVKVVIQHPEPKKRKPRKKKDSKKDEAIAELKEELQSYDEVQNQAGESGVNIPAELGVSPAEASALKSADDIKQFIQMIRQKKEAIIQLMAGPTEPARRPNRFIDLPRPGIIPEVPQQLIPQQLVPAQVAPQQVVPRLPQPPVVRPEIEGQLKALEEAEKKEALKITKTPSIKKFEEKTSRIPAEIRVKLDNIESARKANNGVLTKEQIDKYITELEVIGERYLVGFKELSPQSQALMLPEKEAFVAQINIQIDKLKDELSGKLLPLPLPAPSTQPTKKPWKPVNKPTSGLPYLREYIRVDLDEVEISPIQQEDINIAIRNSSQITAGEELIQELIGKKNAKKQQLAVSETLQAIKKDKEEREITDVPVEEQKPKPVKEPQPQEVEADKEARIQKARKDLTKYTLGTARKGYQNWGNKIKNALRTIGVSGTEITRIENIGSGGEAASRKKDEVLTILKNLEKCPPGSRRAGCPPPKQPAVMMAGRNVPRGQAPPPAKPQPTVIQATTYPEYTRLKQQYAGAPNVIVQAPASALTQKSIETKIGLDTPINLGRFSTPNQQADLSSSRLPRAP